MASFVREVLSATGRLGEKEDFSAKASRLRHRVDDLKTNLRERIESRYDDFSASFAEVSTAVAQLDSVLHEVEALERSVNSHLKPGLAEAGKEATEVSRQLRDLSRSVQIANLTKKAYEELEESSELLDRKQYLEASAKLENIEHVLKNVEIIKDDDDTKRSLKAIGQEQKSIKEKIGYILGKDWDENVKIVPHFNEDDSNNKLQNVKLELNYGYNGDDKLKNLVQAMNQSDVLSFRQQKFCQNLISHVIQPLLQWNSSMEAEDKSIILHFKERRSKPDNPTLILDALETIFLFLGKLFDFPVTSSSTFITSIGEQLSDQVIDIVIKQCLNPSVPEQKSHLDDFDIVIHAVKSFHSSLIEMKFFKASDKSALKLIDFVNNIDETFTNKKCRGILAKARHLMKKDLHMATIIEDKSVMSKEDVEDLIKNETNFKTIDIDCNIEEELLPLPQGMSLNDGLFKFPRCQVSCSVLDLIILVKEVIAEALEANDHEVLYAARLLVTARNIFELYNDVLPVSHSQSLKSFPLNSALGYNNCMYLAHECLQIYIPSEQLPSPLKQRPLTFADLVPRLRQTGVEVFLTLMRKQRDDFRSQLRDSVTGFGQLDGSNMLPPASEKCLKQVLHQLQHLRKLWQDVLPLSIYRRAIGTILNTIVEELAQKVVNLEDIAADAAVQICMLFTFLQDKAPDLFVLDGKCETSKGDAVRYVRKWNRFKELIVLLNASLREIEDRWASGKGPLANEFTPDEIKRLIRALFQNTDRRAAVLSRIK